ncbi:putative PTS system, cellobiose-specific IIC component [Selenomonas ruminantium subsp. lactilytica TAM6421]|uniref:Permease IIC component n=1 Tax=Selenomonas ruminantium subsp. lactilytica (strain NBRC 103574 / TAM6421) TaxID=927704 RepID=I0GS95_SELRL|nr:PTS transporter subunit EIIC [Selenomonas ruminantium]BAL83632.1 putative PTS system, cellobiose-specific IIC component [Selenomonas ruminantium subsp. lactilytica TAM6421]
MSGVISSFERVMMPLAARISGNKYLLAMRDAFSMLLPFIIVGSFFGIIQWVLLDPWGTVMGANGLNLGAAFTGLDTAGDAYKNSQFVRGMQVIQGLCNNVVTVGFGVFSFLLVGAFAYRLGTIWGGDPFANALTALGAFIIVTPQSVGNIAAFDLSYFGNKAVLTAIIVATLSSKMFIHLSKNQKLTIRMPETVPPAVANSFAVLMPVFIVLFSFTLFATLLSQMEFMGSKALNDLIYALIQAPLMGFSQGIGFSILYQGIVWFFWWFGIHGHNVTAAIQNMVYMPAQLANQSGDAAYIFSNGFFEAGLMHVLGLLIAIFLFSRRESWRAVAKVGFPAMLFNIQEPIAFGLPIVLNPILLVPYILAPLANTIVGWLAVSAGIVPIFKYVVPWTMPLFFGGTIGTGSLAGGILQLVWLAMDICIYAPFVIAGNKIKDTEEE